MDKINLNSSVIVFYRKDSADRELNLKTLIEFYNKHYDNYEFIVVEQPHKQHTIDFTEYDKVRHIVVDSIPNNWNKMKAYNEAVKQSFYDNLIFNDVDVIFGPTAIEETLEILSKDNKKVILPNDGHFICIKQPVRDEFVKNLDYNYLCTQINMSYYHTINYDDEKIHVGHTQSPGGGFITKKRNIFNCNGFNPNFIGWGYEDNETLIRFNKMGYTVCRLSGSFKPIFHINHENAERETNPYYKQNNNICNLVEKMDNKLLYLYSTTWQM